MRINCALRHLKNQKNDVGVRLLDVMKPQGSMAVSFRPAFLHKNLHISSAKILRN